MSLTKQLRSAHSPVSQWFRQHLNDGAMRRLVGTINDRLREAPPLRVPGSNAQLVGTAVDYGVRWMFGPLDRDCSASTGATLCAHHYGWTAAPALVAAILDQTDRAADVDDLAGWCVVLAWFERIAQDGHLPPQLESWVGHGGSPVQPTAIAARVPQADREDTALLLHSAAGLWRDPQGASLQNPTFSAGGMVGGADADWIVSDTIWECKCTWQHRPCSRQHILQLLSYALLDTLDIYQLQHLGWYYVRQEQREVRAFNALCAELLGTADIAALQIHTQGPARGHHRTPYRRAADDHHPARRWSDRA